MRAKKFSLVWLQAVRNTGCFLIVPFIAFMLTALNTHAQPVVTVRFANPEFNCTAQTYNVDVEFKCNTANKQLFGFNISFYYPDDVLEFLSFGEFNAAYSQLGSVQKYTGNSTSGMTLFGFPGASERVNAAVQKSASTVVYLPSNGTWLKLFNANFHVDDPTAISTDSFCPPLIWDMKENPANGGISNYGLTITLVVTYPNTTTPATVNVNQFNWQYDGNYPTLPHGYPAPINCIDPNCAVAPDTQLPVMGFSSPGTIDLPVTVTDFESIGAFNLAFEYDPAVMTYSGNTPNAIFNATNGLLTVTDVNGNGSLRKLSMNFNGSAISMPDNDPLAILHFNYIQGNTDLTWITDGTSCKYFNASDSPLNDQPYSNFYHDGKVLSLNAPITKIDSAVAVQGNFVTYSVKVWDFVNILSGLLTLTYDPEVLVFQDALPNSALGSSFVADFATPGLITLTWLGDASLADESALVYLTFQYLGGTAPLSWFDDGSSCNYTNCILNVPLEDQPTENYYINGNVTGADFVWTGETSNDWNNGSNWINNVVPNEYTNVTIDPAASRSGGPVFDGDFTLGVQCKNLIMVGDAQFTVTGDLTINPGNTLEMTGEGLLQVGGDWTNSGTFFPGMGTIEFIGDLDGTIAEGVPPENYVAAYILTTVEPGMTLITGGTAGPTGDNASSTVPIGFSFKYLGVNYTQVRINTNGWMSLNLSGDEATSMNNPELFTTSAPTTVLAPWWDDLKADASSSITYKTEGSAPNRIFTVQWKDVLAYSSTADARLNFQVKIYETTNVIEFLYGSISGSIHSISEGASIGIKDETGGFGHFLEATVNSTNIILSFLKSEYNWPSTNYRFTPPVASEYESFYKVIASKTISPLNIAKDVVVMGME